MGTSEIFNKSVDSADNEKQIPNLRQMGVEAYLSLPVQERCNLVTNCLSRLADAMYEGSDETEIKKLKDKLLDNGQIKELWKRRGELSKKDFSILMGMLNPAPFDLSCFLDENTERQINEIRERRIEAAIKKEIGELEEQGNENERTKQMVAWSIRSITALPDFSLSAWLEIPPRQDDVCPFSGLPADIKLIGGYGSFDESALLMHHSVAKDFINFAHNTGHGISGITIVKYKPDSKPEILFNHPACAMQIPEEREKGFTNNIGALNGRTTYDESDEGISDGIEENEDHAEVNVEESRNKLEAVMKS